MGEKWNILFFYFLIITGTTEKTLIEVLTQRSNAQRQLIATAYEKATGRVWEYFIAILCDQRKSAQYCEVDKKWVYGYYCVS